MPVTTTPPPAPSKPAAAPVKPLPPPPPLVTPVERPSAGDDIAAAIAKSDVPAPAKPTAAPVETPATPAPVAPTEVPAEPAAASGDDDYVFGAQKPVETPKPPDPGPVKAPELRAAYQKTKARVAELEKELADVKIKPIEDAERRTFTDQIATLTKQLEEHAQLVKFAAYEQSDEYKAKFEQPFVEAWHEGVQLVAGLNVTDADGNARKGTPDDFQAVMREPDNVRATEIANDLFGQNSFYVLAQRRDLQRLNAARTKALAEFNATREERAKAEAETTTKFQADRQAQQIAQVAAFKTANATTIEKYPQWFGPEEGDDAGNKILEKGFQDADLAFAGGLGLTDEKRILLHSAIRNRAAGFGRLVHRLKARDAKITELEGVIAGLRGSTPGAGQVGKIGGEARALTADEEFELAAAKR